MSTYNIVLLCCTVLLFTFYFAAKKLGLSKKVFIIYISVINITYIVVRFFSIPIMCGFPSFLLGSLLFSAELIGLFAFFVYVFIFTGKKRIPKKTLIHSKNEVPSVDVLICTYNEQINLLSKTILAATKLDYPKEKLKIYVLDDGNRQELKDFCYECGVNYITRSTNENAKAGNINNALKQIGGELFTVLDADMICKPNYLSRIIRILL